MDIKPPKRPKLVPQPPLAPTKLPPTVIEPIADQPTGLKLKGIKHWSRRKKIIFFVLTDIVVLLVALLIGVWVWYQSLLAPLSDNKNEHIKVTIAPASTPAQIGKLLQDQKVIRSEQAFGIYTRLNGTQGKLQAGTYRLSPADSTPRIVEHLTSGNVDTFSITFLPGATLAQNRKVLTDAGYTTAEINAALTATYDSPLFADKPTGADLEGYIYGDTYKFGSGATVEEILQYTFDTFAAAIEKNDLSAQFEAQGLNLYEGITLASIIQREASGGDEAQIAQVFYSRMKAGMVLGSDVTYQYIADKEGVPRDPNLDSPYNTRRYPGLPPGPIATPGIAALKAVAQPAPGDYLFFLSGDDDVTYFARTNEEHEQNIIDHCKVKCSIL